MIGSISGQIRRKAAQVRSEQLRPLRPSRVGRWFWEIDRVLLLLIAVLIGDRPDRGRGRLARGGERYSGGGVRFSAAPLFLPPDRLDRRRPAGDDRRLDAASESAPRISLGGAAFFLVLLVLRADRRPRGERRDALDRRRHRPAPAVRVPEALLRRRHGLAAVAAGAGQDAAGVPAVGGGDRRSSRCC